MRTRHLQPWIKAAIAAAALFHAAAASAAHGAPRTFLAAAGPVDPANGYPLWYQDSDGLTLELCLTITADVLCLLDPAIDLPDPTASVSFPGNFPEEAFWWTAGAAMETGQGRALLVLALEAAFLPEVIAYENEIAFGRVRFRFDVPGPGTYVVTHPYGVDTFVVGEGDDTSIFSTEDVGADVPRAFAGALRSRIDPFLTVIPDDPPPPPGVEGCPAPPPGYVGDSVSPCRVTGSPHGTNFFRIEGPGIRGDPAENPFACPDRPTSPDCIQTDLFTVTGKKATRYGVGVGRATYTRGQWDPGIEVFAHTRAADPAQGIPPQQLVATAAGASVTLETDGTGKYFGFLAGDFTPGTTITATNVGDASIAQDTAVRELPLTDNVHIVEAYYYRVARALEIVAETSDAVSAPADPGVAVLTAYDEDGKVLGALTPGLEGLSLIIPNVAVPPREVTVRSWLGGSATQIVDVGICGRAGQSQQCVPR